MDENELSRQVVDAALCVHKELGPGLLESVYERVLAYELKKRGINVKTQVPIAIDYQEMRFDEAFRGDLLVNDKLLIELKSVERLQDVHKKQLLTYLKLADFRLGLPINFGQTLLKDGVVRIANRM